jgi:preprotein translocase subunit SecF
MQERKTVLRGYSREAQKTKTEKEKHMHSAKIITALIAITFLLGPAVVYAANLKGGAKSQYQNRYETQTQNTIQNRYQKNDSSRDGTGVKSRTRTQATTSTRTRNRINR